MFSVLATCNDGDYLQLPLHNASSSTTMNITSTSHSYYLTRFACTEVFPFQFILPNRFLMTETTDPTLHSLRIECSVESPFPTNECVEKTEKGNKTFQVL